MTTTTTTTTTTTSESPSKSQFVSNFNFMVEADRFGPATTADEIRLEPYTIMNECSSNGNGFNWYSVRRVLCGWILKTCREMALHNTIAHRSIALFDRYLSICASEVPKGGDRTENIGIALSQKNDDRLMHVIAACLLLSIKLENDRSIGYPRPCKFDGSYSFMKHDLDSIYQGNKIMSVYEELSFRTSYVSYVEDIRLAETEILKATDYSLYSNIAPQSLEFLKEINKYIFHSLIQHRRRHHSLTDDGDDEDYIKHLKRAKTEFMNNARTLCNIAMVSREVQLKYKKNSWIAISVAIMTFVLDRSKSFRFDVPDTLTIVNRVNTLCILAGLDIEVATSIIVAIQNSIQSIGLHDNDRYSRSIREECDALTTKLAHSIDSMKTPVVRKRVCCFMAVLIPELKIYTKDDLLNKHLPKPIETPAPELTPLVIKTTNKSAVKWTDEDTKFWSQFESTPSPVSHPGLFGGGSRSVFFLNNHITATTTTTTTSYHFLKSPTTNVVRPPISPLRRSKRKLETSSSKGTSNTTTVRLSIDNPSDLVGGNFVITTTQQRSNRDNGQSTIRTLLTCNESLDDTEGEEVERSSNTITKRRRINTTTPPQPTRKKRVKCNSSVIDRVTRKKKKVVRNK